MNTTYVALVDDQQLFRQGIGMLISNTPGMSLCFEADNGQNCLDQLKEMKQLPDIALVDMEMPVMDGMELVTILQQQYPDIKIIMLSVHSNERMIARMIQLGASGYLIKNCDKEELIKAIQATHTSGFYINGQALKAMQAHSGKTASIKSLNGILIELSAREKEVLEMICREFTTAEIADKLFISTRTVEGHRNNLLIKTGCRNTAGLVLFAVKHHLHLIDF